MNGPTPKKVKMVLVRDNEWDQWIVKVYEDGKYQEGPTAYTDYMDEAMEIMAFEALRYRQRGVEEVELVVSPRIRRRAEYKDVDPGLKKKLGSE